MTHRNLFVEPIDVLMLRGNRQFGEGGDWGEALMPPWPSLFSGALRSAILSQQGVDIKAFIEGNPVDEQIRTVLGNPADEEYGTFRLMKSNIGRRLPDGTIERLFQLPSDLEISKIDELTINYKLPIRPSSGMALSSSPLPKVAYTQGAPGGKVISSYLLTTLGFAKWMHHAVIDESDLVSFSSVFEIEGRLGIGIDKSTGTAQESLIYTTDAISMKTGYGFLLSVDGDGGLLDPSGLLRLGGDGRGATYEIIAETQLTTAETKAKAKAKVEPYEGPSLARIYLNSPAIFEGGWVPNGTTCFEDVSGKTFSLEIGSFTGEISAVAGGRLRTVSGWDLAKGRPKEALRSVPTGTVYFIEGFDGELSELSEVASTGLWFGEDAGTQRRAEGYNQCEVAFA